MTSGRIKPNVGGPRPSSQTTGSDGPTRGKAATVTGSVAAGTLFFRDRVIQGGLIASALPRLWREDKGAKWAGLWAFQLLVAEDSNDVVPPHGDLVKPRILGRELPVPGIIARNFWQKGFQWNHGIQLAMLPVMSVCAAYNWHEAIGTPDSHVYDTRSGRTAIISTVEGAILATAFSIAGASARKAPGYAALSNAGKVASVAKAAFMSESLGGRALWAMLVVAENGEVANEWGKLDFLGHKDTDAKPSFVNALTAGLVGSHDVRTPAERERDAAAHQRH